MAEVCNYWILRKNGVLSVRRILLALAVGASAMLSGCAGDSLEQRFYASPRSQWSKNLERLPLSQQWNVYLYGVKTREPPPFELSIDLAKRRSDILPSLIHTVTTSNQKTDLESVSTVLQMMREVVHYDFCTYPPIGAPDLQKAIISKLPDGTKYACR